MVSMGFDIHDILHPLLLALDKPTYFRPKCAGQHTYRMPHEDMHKHAATAERVRPSLKANKHEINAKTPTNIAINVCAIRALWRRL